MHQLHWLLLFILLRQSTAETTETVSSQKHEIGSLHDESRPTEKTNCSLYIEEGDRVADCSGLNLNKLPDYLSDQQKLVKLNISYNNISILSNYTFTNKGVKKLYISHNIIEEIGPNAFHYLISLQGVDLSYNKVKTVPPHLLCHISSLLEVDLRNNPLQLAPETFLYSESLLKLDIRDCNISTIYSDTFLGLGSLETLILSGNHLQSPAYEVLLTMQTLRVLNLTGNPLVCDDNQIQLNMSIPNLYGVPECEDKTEIDPSIENSCENFELSGSICLMLFLYWMY